MAPATPASGDLTLRFKHKKTTVLLLVDQMQTFTSIKKALLHALQNISYTFDGEDLPASASEFQFGVLVDPKDPRKGFTRADWERTALFAEDSGKGKGKAKGRPSKSVNGDADPDVELATASNINECPKGAGLRDGSVLAFRWGKKDPFEEDIVESNTEEWDVKVPDYEETYGVEKPEYGSDAGEEAAEGRTLVVTRTGETG